ncbi:MAG: hypothetical protein AAF571_09685 [Verrucomicrobiota bacterium]
MLVGPDRNPTDHRPGFTSNYQSWESNSRTSNSQHSSKGRSRIGDQLRELEKSSPGELLEKVRELRQLPVEHQALAIPAVLSVLADSDPAAALQEAKQLKYSKDPAIAMILAKWTQSSPAEAAAYYKKYEQSLFTRNHEDSDQQLSGSSIIAQAMLDSGSYEHAVTWARSLGNIADRNLAFRKIMERVTAQSPQAALVHLQNLADGERDIAIQSMAHAWPAEDIDSAIDWINTLEYDEQSLALPKLIKAVARRDPYEAATYLEYIDGNRDAVTASIIEPLIEKDPAQAADWLITATTPEEHRFLLQPVLQRWVDSHPETAKNWAIQLKDGATRDEAIAAYARITTSGIEEQTDLINLIHQEIRSSVIRERALVNVLVSWSLHEPELAKEYAHQTGLSSRSLARYLHEVKAQSPLD